MTSKTLSKALEKMPYYVVLVGKIKKIWEQLLQCSEERADSVLLVFMELSD